MKQFLYKQIAYLSLIITLIIFLPLILLRSLVSWMMKLLIIPFTYIPSRYVKTYGSETLRFFDPVFDRYEAMMDAANY